MIYTAKIRELESRHIISILQAKNHGIGAGDSIIFYIYLFYLLSDYHSIYLYLVYYYSIVFVLCMIILYSLIILKIKHDVFIRIEFRRFGLLPFLIVNQNQELLYNLNLRIIINFKRDQVLIIRCNRNYTEFSQLKRMAASLYSQGFSGIGENQGMENYTELYIYTF